MTSKQAVARRKELESQRSAVLKNYYAADSVQRLAENDNNEAQSALTQARIERARGLLGIDIEAIQADADAAQARLVEVKAQNEAVYQARQSVELELEQLLAYHFETFAEGAEQKTAHAMKAFALADRALLAAEKAWNEAVGAWRPLCQAAKIPGVPPFPLSRAAPIPARPPSVSAGEDAAA